MNGGRDPGTGGKWVASWAMACCGGSLVSADVGERTTRTTIAGCVDGTRLWLRLPKRP